jgi:hypothetical protein
MTDERRMILAVALFLAGAIVTAAVSVVGGMAFMVAGLAALLWGRKAGDRRP